MVCFEVTSRCRAGISRTSVRAQWHSVGVLALVFACLFAPAAATSAEYLGARVLLTNSGLDYTAGTAAPLLASFVANNLSIPEIDCHVSKSLGPITTVLEVECDTAIHC